MSLKRFIEKFLDEKNIQQKTLAIDVAAGFESKDTTVSSRLSSIDTDDGWRYFRDTPERVKVLAERLGTTVEELDRVAAHPAIYVDPDVGAEPRKAIERAEQLGRLVVEEVLVDLKSVDGLRDSIARLKARRGALLVLAATTPERDFEVAGVAHTHIEKVPRGWRLSGLPELLPIPPRPERRTHDASGAPLMQAERALPYIEQYRRHELEKDLEKEMEQAARDDDFCNLRIEDFLKVAKQTPVTAVDLVKGELWFDGDVSDETVSLFAPHPIRSRSAELKKRVAGRNPHRLSEGDFGEYGSSWASEELKRMRRDEEETKLIAQPAHFETPEQSTLIRQQLRTLRARPAVKTPEVLHFVNRLLHAPVVASGTPERLFGCFDLGGGWYANVVITHYPAEKQVPLENEANHGGSLEIDGGDVRLVAYLRERDFLAGTFPGIEG